MVFALFAYLQGLEGSKKERNVSSPVMDTWEKVRIHGFILFILFLLSC